MDLLNHIGELKVISQFYELKRPDGKRQIVVFPKQKSCVCCNISELPLIKLKSCSHTNFLEKYFVDKIDLKLALVCHYCHGILKKIDDFKKQVAQNILGKVPDHSKATDKFQRSKLQVVSVNPNPLMNLDKNKIIIIKKHITKKQTITPIKQETDSIINIDVCDELINSGYKTATEKIKSNKNVLTENTSGVSRNLKVTEENNTKNVFHNIIDIARNKDSSTKTIDISLNNDVKTKNVFHNIIDIARNIDSSTLSDISIDYDVRKNDLKSAKNDEVSEKYGPTTNDILNLSGDMEIEMPAWHINTDNWQEAGCEILINNKNVGDNKADDIPASEGKIKKPVPQENIIPSMTYIFEGKIALVSQTDEELQSEREARTKDVKYMNLRHKCELCLVGFNHEDTLSKHVIQKHDKNIGDYVCIVCQSVYASENALQKHGKGHWIRYQCMVCQLKFKSEDVCIMHYNEVHGTNGESISRLYECYHDDCDFTTTNSCEYKKHRRQAHGKRLECGECGKFLSNINYLKKHVESVHAKLNRTYKCHICAKEYRSQSGITLHCKSEHTDNTPAFCTICKRQYKNAVILNAHLKMHSTHVANQQLRYICDHCGKRFVAKHQVRAHIEYRHLKIKYQCKECDQSFNFMKSLKRHMKIKHGNEPTLEQDKTLCQYCGKGFKHVKSLRSHIWSHTGERPLQCSRCPANFAHSAALYNHNRLVHKVPRIKTLEKYVALFHLFFDHTASDGIHTQCRPIRVSSSERIYPPLLNTIMPACCVVSSHYAMSKKVKKRSRV